jgi:hypothetical protein
LWLRREGTLRDVWTVAEQLLPNLRHLRHCRVQIVAPLSGELIRALHGLAVLADLSDFHHHVVRQLIEESECLDPRCRPVWLFSWRVPVSCRVL